MICVAINLLYIDKGFRISMAVAMDTCAVMTLLHPIQSILLEDQSGYALDK